MLSTDQKRQWLIAECMHHAKQEHEELCAEFGVDADNDWNIYLAELLEMDDDELLYHHHRVFEPFWSH